MTRIHLAFAMVLCFFGICGSVKNGYSAPKNDPKSKTYDSSVNFLGLDVTKYVGQELFLTEKPGNDREFGFSGFFTKPDSKDENVYKPNDKFYTTYSAIAGKYFKVLEIAGGPETIPGEYFFNNKCFLKLQDKDSGNVIYYEYSGNNEFAFPFIVTGFYQKQKSDYIGHYFVYADTVLTSLAGKTDLVTGKPVTFRTGETWKCLDIKIPEASHNLLLIIQNTLGEKTTIPYGSRAFSLIDELTYKKKFGIPTFNRLLRGELFPGMTKEMVKISIGEPFQVNGSLTHGTNIKKEDWLYYSGKTLSFHEDKLVEVKDTPTN